MAALSPAVRRIRYRITGTYPYSDCREWEAGSPNSPATISGGPHEIRSYALPIAWKDGDEWIVTNEQNSPTTNRHIRAAHMALAELGYVATGDKTIHITRHVPWSGFEPVAVPVTSYRSAAHA